MGGLSVPGYKDIWKISYPLMIGLLAHNIINATDTAFLGRVGEVELGAAALGGMYFFVLFIIGFGFSTGAQIIMSRRTGEKRWGDVGPVLQNTIYFLLLLSSVLILCSSIFQDAVLERIISSPEVAGAAGEYTRIRTYGLVFAYLSTAFRAFHISRSHTRPILWNAALIAGVNIILDYVLIFGKLGIEPMGIAGAAWASTISEGVAVLFYLLQAAHPAIRRKYRLYQWTLPNRALMVGIGQLSSYVMLQNFLSVSTWFGFFLIVEKTGEANLASTNIVRSIYSLIGIPIWAYFSSVITLVSSAIGAGNGHQLFAIVRRVALMSLGTSLLLNATVWFFPSLWLELYTNDAPLRHLSMESLYVITLAHSGFALAGVLFHAVSGTGMTRISLSIEVISLIFYLAYLLFLRDWFEDRVAIAWFSECIYITGIGILSFMYLKKGHWARGAHPSAQI